MISILKQKHETLTGLNTNNIVSGIIILCIPIKISKINIMYLYLKTENSHINHLLEQITLKFPSNLGQNS